MSAAMKARSDAKFAMAESALGEEDARHAPLQQKRIWKVPHRKQVNNYYCGPASGVMIAVFRKMGPSTFNRAPLNQGSMGGPAHMRTKINGGTQWARGTFVRGLNRWQDGRNTTAYSYVQTDHPTHAQFRTAMEYGIDFGALFAADTVEFAMGTHYNGHPVDQTIGHWIVARGYSNGGRRVHFNDPSAGLPGWHSSKVFGYNRFAFNNRFLRSNGIAW